MGTNKKRYNDQIDRQFVRIPNEFAELRGEGLDVFAKMIWLHIVSQGPTWDSSRNNIARNLEISVNTVTDRVAVLEKLNMLRKIVGPKGNWDFEVMPRDEWITYDPDHPVIQAESSRDPGLNHPVIHIQEERRKKSREDNFISPLKDDNFPSLSESPKVTAPTQDQVYNSWLGSLPDKIQVNQRSEVLTQLFTSLKDANIDPETLSKSFRDKVISKLVPLTRPKSVPQEKYDTWKNMVNQDFDKILARTFYANEQIQTKELSDYEVDLAYVSKFKEMT